MTKISILHLIAEADSLKRIVVNSFAKKKKFDNKFLLSLATMAFEKYFVAFLSANNDMPSGHTLSYLVAEVNKYVPISRIYMNLLLEIDQKIQLCSIEVMPAYYPTDFEMNQIIEALENISELVANLTEEEV